MFLYQTKPIFVKSCTFEQKHVVNYLQENQLSPDIISAKSESFCCLKFLEWRMHILLHHENINLINLNSLTLVELLTLEM